MKITIFIIMCILILVFCSIMHVEAQTVIRGKVRDLNTHDGISQVNIWLKGTQLGTVTDKKGNFNLLIRSPNPDMVLIFQHIGYVKKEYLLGQFLEFPFFVGPDKSLYYQRTELFLVLLDDLAISLLMGFGLAVRPVSSYGVVGIGYRDDRGKEGICLPRSPSGYPFPSKRS